MPLHTSDGVQLAADLAAADDPRAVAVLAHPHPQYGGNRHHPLVDALFRTLPGHGVTTVRFDFRGGGDSGGAHGGGIDERLDVTAALDALAGLDEAAPWWLVGYSFGAVVCLDVVDPRVHGWIGVAPPLTMLDRVPLAAADQRLKQLLVPEHDRFCPPAAVAAATATWTACSTEVVPMADHFLHGAVQHIVERVAHLLTESP